MPKAIFIVRWTSMRIFSSFQSVQVSEERAQVESSDQNIFDVEAAELQR